MGRRLTQEQFIEKSRSIHGDKYDYSQTEFVETRGYVKIVCKIHGVFEQRASSHLQGNGCPECAKVWSDEHKKNLRESSRKSRGMTTEEWIERAKAVHGDKYDYSQTEYVNQRNLVKIICPKHGMFMQKADSHLRGHGCSKCWYESEECHNIPKEWSDEQREKIKATCRERYGADRYLDSVEGKQKIKTIKANPEYREKMHNIISSNEVQTKTKATCVDRYGVESPMQLNEIKMYLKTHRKEIVQKINDTKRKNGTFNTSEPECTMYDILKVIFGDDDVVPQYNSCKYPFACDFYVKSRDLYIELNASWTHGHHWYNKVNDCNKLSEWLEKSEDSDYYKTAIETWTQRDVTKRNVAKKNGLNYVVFWKSDLSDFNEWIDADCPDGHDYDTMYSWKI